MNVLIVLLFAVSLGCSGGQTPVLENEDGNMVSEINQSDIMRANEPQQMPKKR